MHYINLHFAYLLTRGAVAVYIARVHAVYLINAAQRHTNRLGAANRLL